MEWGLTPCRLRCGRPADCLLDGDPYCLDCVDSAVRDELPLWFVHRVEEAALRTPRPWGYVPASDPVVRAAEEAKLVAMREAFR